MGNVNFMSDDHTLKYNIQKDNKTYDENSNVIYDHKLSTNEDKDYFTPIDIDHTKMIKFNDVEEHNVLMNARGLPIITTYGSDYIQAMKDRNDRIYRKLQTKPDDTDIKINYGHIWDDEAKYKREASIKTLIAIIIIIIVSVLLAILLDDLNWYFLLILLLIPIIYFIVKQTSNNKKSWYHVYLYVKKGKVI
jgi:hypothetical protein